MIDDPVLVLGRVVAAYGVAGWVKVEVYTEKTDGLLHYPVWWRRGHGEQAWQPMRCLAGRTHGAALVVHLAGIDDRDAAAAVTGSEVGAPRSALPPTASDEIYWADLVGLTVVNREGRMLGRVSAVVTHGAHPLLQVSAAEGEGPDRLIPYVPAVIDAVDRAAGRIDVDWGEDY